MFRADLAEYTAKVARYCDLFFFCDIDQVNLFMFLLVIWISFYVSFIMFVSYSLQVFGKSILFKLYISITIQSLMFGLTAVCHALV